MFRNRTYKTPRTSSGQSTVEYILIVTAVVAVIIAMSGAFKTKMNSTLETTTNGIADRGLALNSSHEETVEHVDPKIQVDPTANTSVFDQGQ